MRKLPVVLLCRSHWLLRKNRNYSMFGVGRGSGGRVSAQDVARVTRSTKPCGPDTPMLVSTLRAQEPGGTVTKTPGTPRRARYKSSNIARGMPDVFGCTCDHSCAFSYYSCTRDRGCNGARHSLRPRLGGEASCITRANCVAGMRTRVSQAVLRIAALLHLIH